MCAEVVWYGVSTCRLWSLCGRIIFGIFGGWFFTVMYAEVWCGGFMVRWFMVFGEVSLLLLLSGAVLC